MVTVAAQPNQTSFYKNATDNPVDLTAPAASRPVTAQRSSNLLGWAIAHFKKPAQFAGGIGGSDGRDVDAVIGRRGLGAVIPILKECGDRRTLGTADEPPSPLVLLKHQLDRRDISPLAWSRALPDDTASTHMMQQVPPDQVGIVLITATRATNPS